MKSKEELNALKEEVETVSRKLHELTEEELAQVSGGVDFGDLGDRVFGLSSSRVDSINGNLNICQPRRFI